MSKRRIIRPKTPELGDFKTSPERMTPDSRVTIAEVKTHKPPKMGSPRPGRGAPGLSDAAPAISPTAEIPTLTPFQLSRFYAQGWAVGMTHQVDDLPGALEEQAEALNPGRMQPERARWLRGFTEAVRCKLAHPARRQPQFRIASNS